MYVVSNDTLAWSATTYTENILDRHQNGSVTSQEDAGISNMHITVVVVVV